MSANKLKNNVDGFIFSAKLGCLKNRTIPFIFILIFTFWISTFAEEQFTYDAKGKRNPFIPLVTSEGMLLKLDKQEAIGDLLIEGIIYDKNGRSYAIVNSTVVEVGGMVGDYQVLKIEQKKVIFIKQGQTIEVVLKEED